MSLSSAASDIYEALRLLAADVRDYPAWQRPCLALDLAEAALAKAAEAYEDDFEKRLDALVDEFAGCENYNEPSIQAAAMRDMAERLLERADAVEEAHEAIRSAAA